MVGSIERAANGNDPKVDPNQDIRAYDREDDHFYPYKSHGQYIRAWYGMIGCFLIAIFNGWQSVVSPLSLPDFLASYINVRPTSYLPWLAVADLIRLLLTSS
jgi:amino acid transporter